MGDIVRRDDKTYLIPYKRNRLVHRRFRFPDFLMIVLCLSGAAISIGLFRNDLFQTINSRNEKKPIGNIYIKDNNVQRRLGDRVLWGRLAVQSPVYLEDLVRVAESSAATLDIEGNHIDLNENTLIRIQHDKDNEGSIQIALEQGSMDLSTNGGKSIKLMVQGKQVRVGPGTVLNAKAGEDGFKIQVSEGSAVIVEQEESHPLAAGTMVALDTEGTEKIEPAVVVTRPRQNIRCLNSSTEALNIDFAWNRINLDSGEALRLEFSRNRNFSNIVRVLNDLDNTAKTALDDGIWYWRLSYKDKLQNPVLSSGQITVVDATGPVLISPAKDHLFRYQTILPQLRFEWSEIAEASSYILEADETPDFTNPKIMKQIAATSFVDSSLGPGTWYWRVKPVFSPIYEGEPVFSSAASFRIEQSNEKEEMVWPVPVTAEPIPLPEEVREEPAPPPRRPVVQPVTLLPAVPDCQPPAGYRIGIEELRERRYINFKWSAVPGANAYIFTLYQEKADGRQKIFSTTENRTSWTLDNISSLDRGTFVWQVEAVHRERNGTIGRRGNTKENSFTVDIPVPGRPSVRIEEE